MPPNNTMEFSEWWKQYHPNSQPNDNTTSKRTDFSSRAMFFLAAAAQMNARDALTLYQRNDPQNALRAAAATGTAAEMISKVALGAASPHLLVSKGDHTSTLLLANHASVEPSNPVTYFRSIEAWDSLTAARKLYAGKVFGGSTSRPYPPFAVRNAALHMGMSDRKMTESAVKDMALLVNEVLAVLNVSPGSFWGSNLWPLVSTIIEEHSSAVEKTFHAKLFAAQQLYESRIESLAPEAKIALVAILESTLSTELDPGEQLIQWTCPACEHTGHLTCTKDRGPIQREIINHHDVDTFVGVTARPTIFECPVCDLFLEDEELAFADDIPGTIDLEPESPTEEDYDAEEWYDDYDRADYEDF
ncbi:hypothetical protein [Brachybacterium kimchii]|uniref:Uncharacterized protein n=1 Tax=Brachybacterium kimchii TaxID=2942909 RepID=A0ABY4NB50_9MICO|nr:hypothetical protein [Brachybacterium kimchii]UQN31788.1 hypothetical protein M4486_19555 [Brachybacterium kimchii]